MRRVLLFLLAGLLALTLFPVQGLAVVMADPTGTFYYAYENSKEIRITGLKDESKISVTLPSEIEGLSVTSIRDGAFKGSGLQSVVIPSTIRSLGKEAFADCKQLTHVALPPNLEEIGRYAFQGCTALRQITLPDKLKRIDDHAFDGCTQLENISLPSGIEYIGDFAFANCSAFTSISVPGSVKVISNGLFSNCSNLTQVVFNEGTQSDYYWSFSNASPFSTCPNLRAIYIPDSMVGLDIQTFKNLSKDTVIHCSYASPAYNIALRLGLKIESTTVPFPGPKDVKIDTYSDGKIMVEWDELYYTVGYDIWRSTNGTDYAPYAVKEGNGKDYTMLFDYSVKKGARYWYKIRGYKLDGDVKVPGDFSEAVSIVAGNNSETDSTPSAGTSANKISTPSKLAAVASAYNVTLSWNSVPGATSYEIQRSTSSSKGFTTIRKANIKKYTDSKVTTSVKYYYRVRAVKTVSGKQVYSAWSKTISAKPSFAKPAITKIISAKKNSASLRWGAVKGAAQYEIERSMSKGSGFKAIKSVKSLSYTDTKVSSGKTYYYRVRAYKVIGGKKCYSPYSAVRAVKVK